MAGKNGVPDNGQGGEEDVAGQQPELTPDQDWTQAGEAAWAELTGEGADDGGVNREPRTHERAPDAAGLQTTGERARDEHGRFVAKPKEGEGETEAGQQQQRGQVQPKDGQQTQDQQQQQAPQAATPPPGWSVKSKTEWERLPQHVREDIAKREQEISAGFAQYSGLKPFADMAAQNGRTLQHLLNDYVGLEHALRTNTEQGLIGLAGKLGWTQHEAANNFLRLAQRLGAQVGQPAPGGEQHQQQQLPNDDPVMAALQPLVMAQMQQYLQPLTQKLDGLQNHFQQQQATTQTRQLHSAQQAVDKFKADPAHKYYANVEGLIEKLLENGMVQRTGDIATDLKTAYEQACLMHPEVREAVISDRLAEQNGQRRAKERDTVQRARAASRSITGSPPGEPIPRNQQLRAKGNGSYDDELYADALAAWEEVAGRA